MNNYNRYNHIKVFDNNIFWKTVKPFFTDKGVNHDRSLLLEEDDKTISDNDEISENKQFLCGYSEKFDYSTVWGSVLS